MERLDSFFLNLNIFVMCALYIIFLKQGSIIMNQETMNYVMQKMSPFLDNGQTFWLEKVLEEVHLQQENNAPYEEDNDVLLERFLSS